MLYHELRRRKDWPEISHQIRKFAGGSSGADRPLFIGEETLKPYCFLFPRPFLIFGNPNATKRVTSDSLKIKTKHGGKFTGYAIFQ